RARQAGFRLLVALNVFVHHFGGRTFLGLGISRQEQMERNRAVFHDKWSHATMSNGRKTLQAEPRSRDSETSGSNQRAAPARVANPPALYLDLLKRCLCNWIHADEEFLPLPSQDFLRPELLGPCHQQGINVVRHLPFNPQARLQGRDWPPTAHTMI